MNNKALLEQFDEWRENDEYEKIVAAVLALPEECLDTEIMYALAEAYLEIEEAKSAIAVLEGLRKTEENTYMWNFRFATALLITVETDSECKKDKTLCENMLNRARIHFMRGMNMNPPDDMLVKASDMAQSIEEKLGFYDDEEEEPDENIDLYTEEEMMCLEEHIEKYFGDIPTVFHEIKSEDIHVDVYVVPPSDERNYYTLVTMGMGAREMNAPEELENKSRCELVMCLPPDWKIGEDAPEWYWPIGLLKSLAHLPIDCDTWLGWGHTVDNQTELAPNTKLCGSLLVRPEDVENGADECTLPDGEVINFFEIIPLYQEEMEYKIDHDTTELLQCMNGVSHIVDINRPNSCEDYISPTERFDNFRRHARKIPQKQLPLPTVNGANHIAIFIRWCIEHELLERNFYLQCPELAQSVREGKTTDLRQFFIDIFDGYLELGRFSFVGANFLNYYYGGFEGRPYYPADVDDYAENYFGTERYNSEEFQDEAYLFVPFDEDYYKGMSEYIQKAFDGFIVGFLDNFEDEIEQFTDLIHSYLDINTAHVPTEHSYYGNYIVPESFENSDDEGHTMAVMIVSNSETATNAEMTAHLLHYALVPLYHRILVADIPAEDPIAWAQSKFTRGEDIYLGEHSEIYDEVAESLGYYPIMLSFDGNPSRGMTLLIPDGDKAIAQFIIVEKQSDDTNEISE